MLILKKLDQLCTAGINHVDDLWRVADRTPNTFLRGCLWFAAFWYSWLMLFVLPAFVFAIVAYPFVELLNIIERAL